MGMSWAYGEGDPVAGLAVLERSLELGCHHWDTADMYGAGENEKLLSQVLKTKRGKVFLATKFGNVYDRTLTSHQDQVKAESPWIVDGTPAYIRKCVDLSLQRLGIEHIDLYYQHRVDPTVPIEETWGAMKTLVEEGKVRFLGISEASSQSIRRANAVHPVSALQSEYSLWTRGVEEDILPTLNELGIPLVAYSPLGRGFLTGAIKSRADLDAKDWRLTNPRFEEDAFQQNLSLVRQVEAVAKRKGVANGQVALAWVIAQGNNILAIPGTKRVKYLEENLEAREVTLDARDLAELANLVALGERYNATTMKTIDA